MVRVTKVQVGDFVVAVIVAFFAVMSTHLAGHWAPHSRPTDAVAIAFAATAALSLTARRTWPLVTLGIATALTSAYLIAGYTYSFILLSVIVAVYTVARHLPLSRSAPASSIALVVLVAHVFFTKQAITGLAPGSLWVALPFAVGLAVRFNRESVARDRTEVMRQHVDDERLRVAQEVHDVVGHGLAAIKMQADVALHLLGKNPDHAEQALTTISRTSADALEELRTTLAVVRRSDVDRTRSTGPGLARLTDLRDRMVQAGMEVRLEVTGTPRELPAAVDLCGYRIVQESLTNALRHGTQKVAEVHVAYDTDAVVITVDNPTGHVAVADEQQGMGIPGMRHRVTSLDGEFTAGGTADGRFEVHASIPTEDVS